MPIPIPIPIPKFFHFLPKMSGYCAILASQSSLAAKRITV
jgi:hypothetical protein